MSTYAESATLRPQAEKTDYRRPSSFRTAGMVIAVAGLMVAAVPLIADIAVSNDADNADTLAWSFGLNFTAVSMIMVGIATTLVGILVRLWLRVDSVKAALPLLKPTGEAAEPERTGEVDTPQGRATVTPSPPKPIWIHRMAENLWVPMIAMGPMIIVLGFILALVQSGEDNAETFLDLSGWVQGLQFLGIVITLSGISFILGTILSSLRKGGGEVQQHLGVSIRTLKVPNTAWAFVALMMMGMMVAMVQFVLYLVAIGRDDPNVWFAWLGPLAQLGIGLMLMGIVLALFTIGTVLAFQFDRLQTIIRTGR